MTSTWEALAQSVYLPARPGISPGAAYQILHAARVLDRYSGNTPPGEITDDMACRFLSWSLEQGCSPATVNSRRRMLLTLWRFAWRRRLVAELPRDVPRVREPRRLPDAWTIAQVERLVAYLRDLPGMIGDVAARILWPAIVLLCWDTSARISSLMRARSSDCSLADRWLVLRQTKTEIEQFFSLEDRTIAAVAPIYDSNRERLVPWPFGMRWLWESFRLHVDRCGLPSPHSGRQLFHRLRRSRLSALAATDLEAARRLAGHASAAMTLRHYVDPRVARRDQ